MKWPWTVYREHAQFVRNRDAMAEQGLRSLAELKSLSAPPAGLGSGLFGGITKPAVTAETWLERICAEIGTLRGSNEMIRIRVTQLHEMAEKRFARKPKRKKRRTRR